MKSGDTVKIRDYYDGIIRVKLGEKFDHQNRPSWTYERLGEKVEGIGGEWAYESEFIRNLIIRG